MPYHIIVYRDGVADNQFGSMLDTEYNAIRQAVDLAGYPCERVKISIIVCQKRHHTRLVYQDNANGEYLNPCVGLVVDAQGSEFAAKAAEGERGRADADGGEEDPLGCIVGSNLNEFYLNSHAAVLGTSKPTKYVLVRDEIGFKVQLDGLHALSTVHLLRPSPLCFVSLPSRWRSCSC
jgi:eukaryotic translation initiation factor 2C